MENKKNILICPLDWGLGHATRCVPIIKELTAFGFNVIIAANNRSLAFLQKEFPELKYVQFPGYHITYSQKGVLWWKMLFSIPTILKGIREEHKFLEKIIHQYDINIVISDNRYGVWNNRVKNVFITHQIMIMCPPGLRIFEYLLYRINRYFISKFDECWIPDFEGGINLSGHLSHYYPLPKNTYFIGALSRFYYHSDTDKQKKTEKRYDLLFILSGPEPQRTIFEKIILQQLKETLYKAVIVRGILEENEQHDISENILLFSHMDSYKIKEYVNASNLIVCRSGYSSIMDMIALGKKAVLVPTPGQTEQEYLAKYLFARILFLYTRQNNFNLKEVINKSYYYSDISFGYNKEPLIERIKSLNK